MANDGYLCFDQYLQQVEGKDGRTAIDYARRWVRYDDGRGALPETLAEFEKLQYVWLAYRRFLVHIGADERSLRWLPVSRWLRDRETRLQQYRPNLADDEIHHAVTVWKTKHGVAASCLGCDESVEVVGESFHEEVGRGVASVVVDDHASRSMYSGGWCEKLTVVVHRCFIIWLEPPDFRTWLEVAEARGPEGAFARQGARKVARDATWLRDWEAARKVEHLLANGGGSASCDCGYLSEAGSAGSADGCPVCGFSGYG